MKAWYSLSSLQLIPLWALKESSISSKFSWVETPSQGDLVLLNMFPQILAISSPYVRGPQSEVSHRVWGSALGQTLYVLLGSTVGGWVVQMPSSLIFPQQPFQSQWNKLAFLPLGKSCLFFPAVVLSPDCLLESPESFVSRAAAMIVWDGAQVWVIFNVLQDGPVSC